MWRMNDGKRLGNHPIANAIGHLIKGYEDLKDCDGFMNYNPGSYQNYSRRLQEEECQHKPQYVGMHNYYAPNYWNMSGRRLEASSFSEYDSSNILNINNSINQAWNVANTT
jgi:hypothetical protein